MNTVKKYVFMMIAALCLLGWGMEAMAQDEVAAGVELAEGADDAGAGFFDVVKSGGVIGVMLWLALLGSSLAGFSLMVDSFLKVRQSKIMPEALIANVKESMEQGDVMKALGHCEEEPSPLANILSAGFSNVEEGFDAIQDSVSVAADLESEKLMQRVNYLNVVGNLAPMVGLLGTVQGMIFAFATLASAGAGAGGALAISISQALYTTAAGLMVAVPALAFFYYFRNKATTIILNMEALCMEEMKVLRHAEVVDDE